MTHTTRKTTGTAHMISVPPISRYVSRGARALILKMTIRQTRRNARQDIEAGLVELDD